MLIERPANQPTPTSGNDKNHFQTFAVKMCLSLLFVYQVHTARCGSGWRKGGWLVGGMVKLKWLLAQTWESNLRQTTDIHPSHPSAVQILFKRMRRFFGFSFIHLLNHYNIVEWSVPALLQYKINLDCQYEQCGSVSFVFHFNAIYILTTSRSMFIFINKNKECERRKINDRNTMSRSKSIVCENGSEKKKKKNE